VYQQRNILRATIYSSDDDPWESETCRGVVEEGHEIEVIKAGTAKKLH
jgi:hypothetical protein